MNYSFILSSSPPPLLFAGTSFTFEVTTVIKKPGHSSIPFTWTRFSLPSQISLQNTTARLLTSSQSSFFLFTCAVPNKSDKQLGFLLNPHLASLCSAPRYTERMSICLWSSLQLCQRHYRPGESKCPRPYFVAAWSRRPHNPVCFGNFYIYCQAIITLE